MKKGSHVANQPDGGGPGNRHDSPAFDVAKKLGKKQLSKNLILPDDGGAGAEIKVKNFLPLWNPRRGGERKGQKGGPQIESGGHSVVSNRGVGKESSERKDDMSEALKNKQIWERR